MTNGRISGQEIDTIIIYICVFASKLLLRVHDGWQMDEQTSDQVASSKPRLFSSSFPGNRASLEKWGFAKGGRERE